MFTFLLAIAPGASTHVHCPIGDQVVDDGGYPMEYKGVRFATCCAHCGGLFQADPEAAIKRDTNGHTIGIGLFDPVDGKRIVAKSSVGSSEYKGVRYYFHSKANRVAFSMSPPSFSGGPLAESLVCPVDGIEIKRQHDAFGYLDFKGVRYYACSAKCLASFRANPVVDLKVTVAAVQMPEAEFKVTNTNGEVCPLPKLSGKG